MNAGQRLLGRYFILEAIGSGRAGVVHRARDDRLGGEVAVRLRASEESGRQFRKARAATKLMHPAIARVIDAGELDGGVAYLVSELVRGRTVRALARDGPIDRDEAMRILSEVSSALDTAHALGVSHGDIKPQNVMVRDDGRVAVLDFGVFKPHGARDKNPADDRLALEAMARELLGASAPYEPEGAALAVVGAIIGSVIAEPFAARGER